MKYNYREIREAIKNGDGNHAPIYGYSQFYLNYKYRKKVGKDGYLQVAVNGKLVSEHRHRARLALGTDLPKQARIHHHNANQLVICEDSGYHKLLHERMGALGYSNSVWKYRSPW